MRYLQEDQEAQEDNPVTPYTAHSENTAHLFAILFIVYL